MHITKFEYFAPTSMHEALSLVDRYGEEVRILAGGTDLLVAAKLENIEPEYIISLRRMEALRGMTYEEDQGLRIGALTSIHQIARAPTVNEKYPALAQAAAFMGSPQLQHMGTIGGNVCLNTRCYYYNQTSSWREARQVCFKMGGDICHILPKGKRCFAVFSADTPPALMAYEAQLKILSSKGERILPIKHFYTGEGKKPNALLPGEVLSEILLPPPSMRQAGIYLKYRIRGSIDFPLAGVAVRLVPNGKGEEFIMANVILNAVGSGPVQVKEAENLLEKSPLSEDVITGVAELAYKAAHPLANTDSTPDHRRDMTRVLTRRALEVLSKTLTASTAKD